MKWSELTSRIRVIIITLIIVASLAAVSSVYNWYKNAPVVSQSEYTPAPEIKKAKEIKHKQIPAPTQIDVLDKDDAVRELKINDPVKSDERKQITATAEIPPYDGTTNVISFMDIKTGVSEIIAKQEPLSFFGFPNKKRMYGKIGYSTGCEIQATIGGEWLFLRVGNITGGVYAEARGYFGNINNINTNHNGMELVAGLTGYY